MSSSYSLLSLSLFAPLQSSPCNIHSAQSWASTSHGADPNCRSGWEQNPYLVSLAGQTFSPLPPCACVASKKEKLVAPWGRWWRQGHWDSALPRALLQVMLFWVPWLHLHPGHGSHCCLALEPVDTEISVICLLAGENRGLLSAEKWDCSVSVFHLTR